MRWEMPEYVGWVIERRDRPGFIAGFKSGFVELDLDPVRVRPLAAPEADLPGNRLNDAKADSRGRIWAGSLPMTHDHPGGSLYRLAPGGAVRKIDGGYAVSNGPAFSPDERWLYHTDSLQRTVYRFALDDAGEPGPREIFITFPPEWAIPTA